MKIAQINPGHMTIPPNSWGAVEKIIWYYKMESEKKGHEVQIKYINEIQRDEFDIVHVHMWNHAIEMHEKGIPYVFTCHDHHAYLSGKNSEIYQKNLHAMINAEISIVPARYLVEYFNNVPVYLRHGISKDEYFPNELDDTHKLLCVGNNGLLDDKLFDRKGFRYAIEAAKRLNLDITVVGPSNNNKDFFNHNLDLMGEKVHIKYDLTDEELIQTYKEHTILIHASSVEAGHPPLTLLEAASCGLPILTTDCSGDLYSIQIDRDVDDIVEKIKDTMKLYRLKRSKTIQSIQNFYWNSVVGDLIGMYESTQKRDMRDSALGLYDKVRKVTFENSISINFIDGARVEIQGKNVDDYQIDFVDKKTSDVVYSCSLQNNTWAKTNRQWFTDWLIRIRNSSGNQINFNFEPSGKRVFIVFESSSLGDTIAWVPYVEEFRKKHQCKIIVSTFHNNLFESQYPDIEFVKPGSSINNIYALYRLGVFYNENGIDRNRHKTPFTKLSLQEIACDILGLDYQEIRPRIKQIKPMSSDKPYICIANHSTAQPKYWNNPTGWQELVDYVKSLGYDVYLLSREEDGYMGNKNPKGVIKVDGKSLEEIGSIILGSQGFIGLGSGLSWLSWALQVPTILISGFSEPYQEMKDVHRIINEDVCHGCFARHLFDKGDWNWCPDHKGTDRQFECTKSITFQMVKPKIDKMLNL